MRLFIATDLPASLLQTIADVQQQLSQVTESARWVRPESMHLTLKFLGEVVHGRLEAIDERLRRIRSQPFKVRVSGVGFFPNGRSPRVFWVGIESPDLRGLAARVDEQTVELGFPSEKRPFRPHLTLARSRGNRRLDSALVGESVRFSEWGFGTFTTDRFCMYQSMLRPKGAVYEKLFEYRLDRRGQSDRGEDAGA
jgi:2'-5' RNA ligase